MIIVYMLTPKNSNNSKPLMLNVFQVCESTFDKNGKRLKRNDVLAMRNTCTVYRIVKTKGFFKVPDVSKASEMNDERTCSFIIKSMQPYELKRI